MKQRSENSPARGQILTVLQRQYRDIAQKTGEICTGPADLQPMLFKSGRLLGSDAVRAYTRVAAHLQGDNNAPSRGRICGMHFVIDCDTLFYQGRQ